MVGRASEAALLQALHDDCGPQGLDDVLMARFGAMIPSDPLAGESRGGRARLQPVAQYRRHGGAAELRRLAALMRTSICCSIWRDCPSRRGR